MRILACYSVKGGVGKTATAINLGYLCAVGGSRTLIWDLDPQGAASYYLRVKSKVKGGGKGLITGKTPLADRIKATDYPNLDLLPADLSYRNLDLVLDDQKKPTKRLRQRLEPLAADYDVIFLDCPPSLSIIAESIFYAAHTALIPVIPTTLSLRALAQIIAFRENKGLKRIRLLPFFSMVDRRKKLHREIVDTLPQRQSGFPPVEIPYCTEVERMGLERAPVGTFAPSSRAAWAYRTLWETVAMRVGATE